MFARILNRLDRRNEKKARPGTATQRKLGLENLECRRLMAGVTGLSPMSPALYNGVLSVMGNSGANTIEVATNGSYITVLGKSLPLHR